jgi:hypothetical protein
MEFIPANLPVFFPAKPAFYSLSKTPKIDFPAPLKPLPVLALPLWFYVSSYIRGGKNSSFLLLRRRQIAAFSS